MQDKRKTKRMYLLYYTRVYDNVAQAQAGNLVDITPEGMMIVCDKPMPEGQTVRFSLELTEEVADKPTMEFTACSKWCKPDVSPNMYNIGFEILEIAPEDTAIVERINKTFGFRDNKPES